MSESYSLTFHPRFAENRFAFVWINLNTRGKPTREDGTRIIRFRVTTDQPPALDLASGIVVFTWLGGGHNGGNLRFGPDGMLYICTGDGAGPDPPDALRTGQDIGDLLSSVLRIDVDRPDPGKSYGIPKDNPFVTTARARGEVWAYGFRNPWRMSFDPKSGSLWVGDVGWELWEMIYRVTRGGNYGWSITEGSKQPVRPEQPAGPTPILPPVVAHPHEEAASITGGEFYHGKKLPQLAGAYVYGDWQFGTLWALRVDGERVTQHRELCRSSLAPVAFGITPDQELLVCDQTGGGLWRLVENDRSHDPAAFPRRLSETGLFRDASGEQPSDGVIPYEVKSARWADHATGKRWVGFPENGVLTIAKRELGVMPAGRWVFPPDAVLAKTYSLEIERGNPATRRRVETQLLHFDGQQWAAYSYRWNDAQTDAQLVPAQGENATLVIKDPAAPGGSRRQTWRFFSRGECLRCHNLWNNFAPGFSPVQLEYPGPASHHEQLAFLLPAGYSPGEAKLVDPHTGDGRIEQRARSYLHANCATCHRYGGGGAVPSFMNIETALGESRLINMAPMQGDLGLPDARIIASGDPHRSVLLYRMATGGRGHMPYLGSQLVDDRGVLLLRAWINEMTAQTAPNAATTAQNAAAESALAAVMAGDEQQLDPLLQSSAGAFRTALALIDGSVRGAIRDRLIVKGSALHDPLKRDLFERFLPDEDRRKTLGKDFPRDALLARKGNRANGEQIFKSICANCHRAAAQGIDFGPELTRIAAKYDRKVLLDQIIDPAKVLEPAWHPTIVTLKNGEAFTGFVVEKGVEAVTIKLPTGEQKRIAAASIENTSTSPVSLMPAGLIEGLTESEAADLIEFVGSLK